MRLEKVQSNALFEAIASGGVDPATCELIPAGRWPGIAHASSQSHFRLKVSAWSEKFIVDRKVANGPETYPRGFTWDDVLEQARKWADEVKAPDLWTDLGSAKETLASAEHDNSGNTPFTLDEQAEISAQLRETSEYVKKTYSLSDEQFSRIQAKLDEVAEASRRMGRKDWLLLFSGAIFTLIIAGTVTPDVAQHILTTALHGLGHLFTGGIKPISGPHTK